eukprot:gene35493-58458_t
MRAALQRRIEAREGIVMAQFEPDASGPRITQPTLVVHDRGDRINPFADGTAFAEAIPGAQLLATDGLGHTRLLRDALVAQAVHAPHDLTKRSVFKGVASVSTPSSSFTDVRAGRLSTEEYAKAFADATPRFTNTQALLEAERCLYCYDAPCATACPTSIDVPSFIKRIADGNLRGSAK